MTREHSIKAAVDPGKRRQHMAVPSPRTGHRRGRAGQDAEACSSGPTRSPLVLFGHVFSRERVYVTGASWIFVRGNKQRRSSTPTLRPPTSVPACRASLPTPRPHRRDSGNCCVFSKDAGREVGTPSALAWPGVRVRTGAISGPTTGASRRQ